MTRAFSRGGFLGVMIALGVGLPSLQASAPLMRVVKAGSEGTSLLRDGNFEAGDAPAPWTAWHKGFRLAAGEGRAATAAIVCQRDASDDEAGATQVLELNRTNVAPFVIRGWSKAEAVSGSPDNGYSLYVDITYADGTPLWGQTASFSCGTHDWEKREFVLLPDKPVKSFALHCLFRGHAGRVWFDDVSVQEIPTPDGTVLFQGSPVQKATSKSRPAEAGAPHSVRAVSTTDGFSLGLTDNAVTSLKIGGTEVSSGAPGGFLVRDCAADSDFYGFSEGLCPDLGLRLKAEYVTNSDHITVSGRLSGTTGKDRAVTLLFALPVAAQGWTWYDDMRHTRKIDDRAEYCQTVNVRSGANKKMSKYPLAALSNGEVGLALGLDMNSPAQYRLVYHAGTGQFFIAYDFGLSPDTAKFPGSADFRFVIYRFEPEWGFRAALQKFYDLFPEQFTKRVSREGVWMPFTDIASIPGFEDFGFAFQEGAPNVRFDDEHDIRSFVYVEPMSYWMSLPVQVARTYDDALKVLNHDLAGGRNQEQRKMAAATLSSGIYQADGRFFLYLVKAPWCDGGVFTLNPDPELRGTAEWPFTKASMMQEAIDAAFTRGEKSAATNAGSAKGLDGVYLDSLEMSCLELNYRREHFRTADVPLVFDAEKRPCQMMIFNTWKYSRAMAAQMHARGKLMFANAVLWNFSFPASQLDVLGTEVNWLHNGTYNPDSDEVMNFRRALCRQKPYCLLLNTDYSKFTPDLVERYFERCLFYGIWPGFFDEAAASKDPYWGQGKKWYERDRPLFRKYLPLLKRVTAAGWQPITWASSDNPKVFLERFGPDASGNLLLTVHNGTGETQSGTLRLQLEKLALTGTTQLRELVSNIPVNTEGSSCRVTLKPYETEVLCFSK